MNFRVIWIYENSSSFIYRKHFWYEIKIISKIRSIKGVIKTEVYQPIRIKWNKRWLKKEDNGQDSFSLRSIYYSSDFLLPIFVLFRRFLYNNFFLISCNLDLETKRVYLLFNDDNWSTALPTQPLSKSQFVL